MGFWDDFIAVNETEIAPRKELIAAMEVGTVEMRTLSDGAWIIEDERWISEDRATVERLVVARPKMTDKPVRA